MMLGPIINVNMAKVTHFLLSEYIHTSVFSRQVPVSVYVMFSGNLCTW